jgi:hypothetical protein
MLRRQQMRQLRTLTALAATASLALAAAPGAFAKTAGVGNSNGTPNLNICLSQIKCTYFNTKNGKPTDVIKRTGTVTDWSVNAGSVSGFVRLRILRPIGGGSYRVARSSAVHTVTLIGRNTFSARIPVRAGDVLALGNDTSGIYMTQANSGTNIRYFEPSLKDGASGMPNQVAPGARLLISAHVSTTPSSH